MKKKIGLPVNRWLGFGVTSKIEFMTFYDLEAQRLNGQKMSMKELEGKIILVVNTASECAFTPQYAGLEKLYQKYKEAGLVVLGFPCNQFGRQESGTSDEIQEFCQVNYGVSFPMFEKIEVNGPGEHPIYAFLKSKLSGGLLGKRIKWNFTKFIIDKNGNPVKRFAPMTRPEKLEKTIEKLI